MALCRSCSAPLLANINRCQYCNVRNDVDLQGKHKYSVTAQESTRICPHCDTPLQTIKLQGQQIEHCKTCFGLFFDPGEIATLLDNTVKNVTDINLTLIKNINRDRYQGHREVKYVKCPCCRVLMNRINFGHRSGVILDRCSQHGVWADSGEITHLMEWKKAGGDLLNTQNKEQIKQKTRTSHPSASYHKENNTLTTSMAEPDLIKDISSLIFRIFS